jgi:hypothetical protein
MEFLMALIMGGSVSLCGFIALKQFNKEYPPQKNSKAEQER